MVELRHRINEITLPPVPAPSAPFSACALAAENAALKTQLEGLGDQLESLKRQIEWFKRQLFGAKSEKRLDVTLSAQADLLAALAVPVEAIPPAPVETITYARRKKQRDADTVTDSGLRFDASVPVETIARPDPADIPEDQRVVIGEKVTHRLAQRPGSYVVLRYVRRVIKHRDQQTIHCAPAPAAVLESSVADVSLLAGLLTDKFVYHLPLYRQHQRLADAGIALSRGSLTQWTQRTIDLLRPIVEAQSRHVLHSKVLAMDETPIKAGLHKPGKMRQAYLWPIYGEGDEIVFRYAPTREHHHVKRFLGDTFTGTLLSDGYEAYSAYAKQHRKVTHAACWSHTRRHFEQAKDADPKATEEALTLIGALYRHEALIRDKQLEGDAKRQYRLAYSEPIVQAFWSWCENQCRRSDRVPSHPLVKALKYARARVEALKVFLADPDVPIDTNHLERALRPVPMGRRNWLFCWTEIGAEQVAIIQSLLVTCRLQGVNAYTYLVDVLQRVDQHPASRVMELTPREWKTRFAHQPLRSDLDYERNNAAV